MKKLKTTPEFVFFHAVSLLCAVVCAWYSARSQTYGEAGLFELWTSTLLLVSLTTCLWLFLWHRGYVLPLPSLLIWAAAFRCIGVFSYPVLEDDHFRYLWDGFQWLNYGTPYGEPPAAFFDDPSIPQAFNEILSFINYPYISTIYGPVNQWFFALAYLIAPGEIWPLQFICALFDFGIVLLLCRLTHTRNVLLYAFSPLILKEFSMTAHPDVIGVFFMVLALCFFRRAWFNRMAIALALSFGSKIFAILIIPLLLGFRLRAWLTLFLTLAVITLTFIPYNPWITDGLKAMGAAWVFNAPLYLSFDYLVTLIDRDHIHLAKMHLFGKDVYDIFKLVLLFCFSVFWINYATRYLGIDLRKTSFSFFRSLKASPCSREIPRGDWIFAVFFIVLPAFNPWYMIWLLPFSVIYPSPWAWVASVAVLLAYSVGLNLDSGSLGLYDQPTWALSLEVGLVLLAFFVGKFSLNAPD